jgi:hypothetical protein
MPITSALSSDPPNGNGVLVGQEVLSPPTIQSRNDCLAAASK